VVDGLEKMSKSQLSTLETGDDIAIEESMCNHTLIHSIPESIPKKDISFDEMRQFLKTAATLKIQLSNECQGLLRDYFLSSRKIRENNYTGTEISVMTFLSESG